MKYSFVLPAYKATFLREAVDSILNQTYTRFELIIVNDASPENLDAIVNKYKDERIQYYVNEENIGGKDLVAQWNHCINYAKGEYLILASDDDRYHPNFLAKIDELTCKHPNANAFRPRIQIIDAEGRFKKTEAFMRERTSLIEFMYLRNSHIMSGVPYYTIKRKALLDIGGWINYPLAWGSDDATIMFLIKDYGIVATEEILFDFRMSGENITSKKNDAHALEQKLKARLSFYDWRDKLLPTLEAKNDLEVNYINWLKANREKCLKEEIYDLMCDSTLQASFECLRNILSIPTITKTWLIICYIKRIFQTIFF